ncbi:MAG: DUF805 domain-containing protein [Candidatus Accumulibacter sp.]|jgi:uncharacterized membrane protein YhaH (DUF805 family)|nr:DUF805 domain-containing protein [Accumulibacter sp.]
MLKKHEPMQPAHDRRPLRILNALKGALFDAVRNTFNFNGRASRREFWLFVLAFLLIHALSFFVLRRFRTHEEEIKLFFDISFDSPLDDLLDFYVWERRYITFVLLPSCLPFFSLSLRRVRDSGLSGAWVLPIWGLSCFVFLNPPFPAYLVVPTWFLIVLLILCRRGDRPTAGKPGKAFSSLVSTLKRRYIPIAVAATLVGISAILYKASPEAVGIVDYRPVAFLEKADAPFFYVFGNRLKHGVSIDPDAPTLFSGPSLALPGIDVAENGFRVYPSPNNLKAAVVSEEKLYLVQPGEEPKLLLKKVDRPIDGLINGESWHRSEFLQWDADSRYIYIARDKKQTILYKNYHTSTSEAARLIRIDTEDIAHRKTIAEGFHVFFTPYASRYFLVGKESACFLGLFSGGGWECATSEGTHRMISYSADTIILADDTRLTDAKFITVDHGQNARRPKAHSGHLGSPAQFHSDDDPRVETEFQRHSCLSVKQLEDSSGRFYKGLFSEGGRNSPYFTFKEGAGLNKYWSVVLPGNKYVFLDIGTPSNSIRILLDRTNGEYRQLQKNTRVYVNDAFDACGKRMTPEILWGERLPIRKMSKPTG